jgi:hypothetical protein
VQKIKIRFLPGFFELDEEEGRKIFNQKMQEVFIENLRDM